MKNNFWTNFYIVFINNLVDATKYKPLFTKDMPLEDCDGYPPEASFQNYFDISNLTFERTEEDTVMLNGYVTYKGGLYDADNPPEGKIELLFNKYGNWIQTPYSLFREDFCSALFGSDENELWYKPMQSIQGRKKCPPDVGEKYFVNQFPVFVECHEITAKRMEGLYKGLIIIRKRGTKTLTCVQIILEVQETENC